MKRLLAVLIVVGCIHAVPVAAQVSGVRSLSGTCAVDQPVEVQLDIDVGDQVPNGVIIVEKIPVGWTLDSATPPPSNFNMFNGELRWVFFGDTVNDEDLDIRYTTSGGDPAAATISGDLRYNDPEGEPQTVPIGGETTCARACIGDCNGDGMVTINEILEGIGFVLSGGELLSCRALDPNGDESITVDEIVTAVSNALNGCN